MRKQLFLLSLLLSVAVRMEAARDPQVQKAPSSRVTVQGTQLIIEKGLVDGTRGAPIPYVMKGINWVSAGRAPKNGTNPLSPTTQVPYGFFFDWPGRNPQGHELMNYWTQQEYKNHYKKDIELLREMNVNTVRLFQELSTSQAVSLEILDALYQSGIMVVMTVVGGKEQIDRGLHLDAVRRVKDHPAILMWAIGNEWNFNKLYGYPTQAAAAQAVNAAAAAVKALDPNHPVSSSLGDRFTLNAGAEAGSDIASAVAACPNVELWGLNIYRGKSFGALFDQWKAVTDKPFYMGEFGIDSFKTTAYTRPFPPDDPQGRGSLAKVTAGEMDEPTQAEWNISMWKEIETNLSGWDNQKPCVGGTLFQFSDPIWKVGNFNVGLGERALVNYDGPDGLPNTDDDAHDYDFYNMDGFYFGGSMPDAVGNEEYFAVVDVDRRPKEAYHALKDYQAQLPIPRPPFQIAARWPEVLTPSRNLEVALPLEIAVPRFRWSFFRSTPTAQGTPVASVLSAEASLSLTQPFLELGFYAVRVEALDERGQALSEEEGTFRLAADPVAPAPTVLNEVRVYPNPWRSDKHAATPVIFGPMSPGSNVKIFTIAGEWVVTLGSSGSDIQWNLKNQDGTTVSSGIYLYLLTDEAGHTRRGKISVIR